MNLWEFSKMIKLYKSTTGLIHIVLGGYICNQAIGKVVPNMRGTRDDITCKNCLWRLN